MKFMFLKLVLFILLILPCTSAAFCNQTCGGHRVRFPFGFSPGCHIQLNCSSNGTMFAAEFPIQLITGDAFLINLEPKCGRPVEALGRLFTANYAPTSRNAILLQNCNASGSNTCFIPTTMVQTHFELLDCNTTSANISCYSETSNTSLFIDYRSMRGVGCRYLFSGISMESFENSSSVSLDVQIVRMGWWLQGECRCSKHATCLRVSPPQEAGNFPAYRCQCAAGFDGDGFLDGLGCRRESLLCNPSKYLSGQCGGTTRVGVLVGGVAAGASLMVSIGIVFCFVRKRSKLWGRSRRSRRLCETAGITIPVYPYKEMEKATNSFSEKRRLGNGAYGTVYTGKLNNHEWVAIKRLRNRDADDYSRIEQVTNEIKLLSSVSHPNLVRLLGCSIETEEQILVYEFMPNGTLSQHLQGEKGGRLPWPVRLTIASETAQAISYLHNAMHPPIYHRDVKSSNILLDYDYKSKVADFGLSRLGMVDFESSHISTAPQGTPGYLDPQYHQHFHLSDKSDVYSFGVVLIEIITGLKVVDFGRPQDEVNLAALAVDRIGRGCLDEIVDPFLANSKDDWTILSVQKAAELAFRCLAFHRDMRPSMMEVAIELEQIRLNRYSSELSIKGSSCSSSSSSNLSEKPLNLSVSTDSLETVTDVLPLPVQDSSSDQSSTSSNSLLNRVLC